MDSWHFENNCPVFLCYWQFIIQTAQQLELECIAKLKLKDQLKTVQEHKVRDWLGPLGWRWHNALPFPWVHGQPTASIPSLLLNVDSESINLHGLE